MNKIESASPITKTKTKRSKNLYVFCRNCGKPIHIYNPDLVSYDGNWYCDEICKAEYVSYVMYRDGKRR